MAEPWYRIDERNARITLTVHVQPNARTTQIAGPYGDALRIRIAAPAVDNKANARLLDFLRETLGVAARSLTIRHGEHGRHKVIEIAGADAALRAKLERLLR